MAKVKIPYSAINPLGGGLDQELYGLAQFAVTAGARAETDSSGEFTTYSIQNQHLPIDVAKLVVIKGGDVSEYPVFIKVQDMDAEVPEGIPYRIKTEGTEEEPVESVKTWSEWMLPNQTAVEINGEFYIPDSAPNNHGLTLSQLQPIFYDVVSMEEMTEIIEANTTEDENAV